MARVTITLRDTEDGRIALEASFDPPITTRDGAELTRAQEVVLGFLHELTEESEDYQVRAS